MKTSLWYSKGVQKVLDFYSQAEKTALVELKPS